jgi:hypothetical protein
VIIDADVPENASGVLYALGGFSGGLSLFMDHGFLAFEYNLMMIERYTTRSEQRLSAGKHTIQVDTVIGKPGSPGTVVIQVDGSEYARLELQQTVPLALLSYTKQESYVLSLVNLLLRVNGYDTIGLNGSTIDAALLQGRYAATTTYGWTEFQIEAITQILTVTVWGINAYPIPITADDFARIADQQPRIVSQFKVNPKPLKPDTAVKANLSTQITTSRKSTKIKQKIKYTAYLRNSGKGFAENAVLNFNILENEADVVSLGKSCHRFGQIISCDLGNVKKRVSRSIILKPLKPGELKIAVTVMTNSAGSILPSIKTVTTKIVPN